MTFEVVYEARALDQASAFLADDQEGLRQVMDAIDALTADPRPADSFPFGSPDLRRIRIGRYRVVYEIKGETVSVGHIARTTAKP
ncbi:type II toxin-antitoxin system RelE/ParE family toxin [Kineosporia rhizophila]|uniref:type II toxin-antitoxin system RelE family toxin n=1 Tax=Kineosporia rhizophila TaxID=84633 RepID=UPI000B1A67F8|nr:type II toxin-antitoxin system RelE/ParE family toxin [Kineosporia rhizophila]